MQTRRIFWMIAGIMAALQTQVAAQALSDTAQLLTEIQQLQSVYRTQELSFDVKYTYTSEQQPGVILDSLQGKIELSGNNYHYWLDRMETIANGHYNITLFKDEKIMYLSKPTALSTGDPLEQVRFMLKRSGVKSCAINQQGNRKTVQVYFNAGGPCRQMDMIIDKTSGYVVAMRYIVKTALLMQPGGGGPAAEDADVAAYGEYAIVATTFDHYKSLTADSTRFDERSFFYKEGNEFKTTPAYNEYKIFTGSPNL